MTGPTEGPVRPSYWFPLVLTGFLLLGVLALPVPNPDFGWFSYAPLSDGLRTGGTLGVAVGIGPPMPATATSERGWYWPTALAVLVLASVAWYGWRARRAGSPWLTRKLVLTGLGALLAVELGRFLLGMAQVPALGAFVRTVEGALAVLGLCALAWSYFRLGPGHRPAAVVGVLSLTVAASLLVVSLAPGTADLVPVVVGLAVLARYERSVLLTVVDAVVLATAVLLLFHPVSTPEPPDMRFLSNEPPGSSSTFLVTNAPTFWDTGTLSVLVPAAVLLLGGVIALIRRRA